MDDLKPFRRLAHSPETALSEIADRLRRGDVDPLFLKILAQMIDPKSEDHMCGVRLIPKRTKGAGAPKKPVNWEMARFISDGIDAGEKTEAAVALACDRFGCSRAAAFEALAALRESRELAREYAELVARYGD